MKVTTLELLSLQETLNMEGPEQQKGAAILTTLTSQIPESSRLLDPFPLKLGNLVLAGALVTL